jgi:hypothetical protein
MNDEEAFKLTDDHEFETRFGWRRREQGATEWEPACCRSRPWLWPKYPYCGLPERQHRMRMLRGPVLILKDGYARS